MLESFSLIDKFAGLGLKLLVHRFDKTPPNDCFYSLQAALFLPNKKR